MKVRILEYLLTPSTAKVHLQLEEGSNYITKLPTDEVLTIERLEKAIASELALLKVMERRMAILPDLVGKEIEIPE